MITALAAPAPLILYSFRRCPYAIRARLALAVAGVAVELREVALACKPPELFEASPKGTVPVLVCFQWCVCCAYRVARVFDGVHQNSHGKGCHHWWRP